MTPETFSAEAEKLVREIVGECDADDGTIYYDKSKTIMFAKQALKSAYQQGYDRAKGEK